MADIILKDLNGKDQQFKGVKRVKLNTSNGGTQMFSEGETIENVAIALDFTDGNQTIYAPEGYLVKSAILQKPENLIPENIVKGVEIAGIVGTSESGCGGSNESNIETDIFPLQPVSGFVEDTGILPGSYFVHTPFDFEIKEGETYYVNWDGVEYTCIGTRASLAGTGLGTCFYLGNGERLGFPGNNEPFAIIDMPDVGMQEFVAFGSTDSSHDIRIYQKGTLPLGYTLKEIVSPKELTFAVGNSTLMPNTPTAVLATTSEVASMDVINNGESGLVIWDGKLYAAYAGARTTPKIQFAWGATTMSVNGSIGNIGIPSAWQAGTVVEDTKKYGNSNEPFLIVANTSHGFQVAIPEDSTKLTHTLQVFKFVK